MEFIVPVDLQMNEPHELSFSAIHRTNLEQTSVQLNGDMDVFSVGGDEHSS